MIGKKKEVCLQSRIPSPQENVLLQFYGFRLATVKVPCFVGTVSPSPEWSVFSCIELPLLNFC